MSELINNQSKKRQEALKKLIKKLHEGVDVDTVKKEFKAQFGSVTTEEIVALEHALVEDGLSVSEIEKLCDVHASVMGTDVRSLHLSEGKLSQGHPLRVLEEENQAITKLIETEIEPFINILKNHQIMMLRIAFDRLKEVDKHYKRKEHLFFPYLEKKGITTPPQVMWGVDDTIRSLIHQVINVLDQPINDIEETQNLIKKTIHEVKEMVFKENNILIPLLQDQLNLLNFIDIAESSDEIGYFLEAPEQAFLVEKETQEEPPKNDDGTVSFSTGSLDVQTLECMLNTLPLDMTFVDKDGFVKYFSHGKERIFERPKTVLGRHVHKCHPPSSVDVVEKIIERFRNGEKDEEAFWINMGKMFVHIRYFAVRDFKGNYLGTLEMTQNIAPIKALEGEKRLLEDLD